MPFVRRHVPSALAAACLLAAPAGAQFWGAPQVSVERLTRAAFPRVPVDEVEIGDAGGLASLQHGLSQRDGPVRLEEVALIRLVVQGDWWFPPADSARQEASLLGANYLIQEYAFGAAGQPGQELRYRAVRLERADGLYAHARPREAVDVSPRALAPPTPAAVPAPAAPRWEDGSPPAAPAARARLDWLWRDHGFIRSHRLGLDLSTLDGAGWRDLERVVRTRFPPEAHAELRRLRRARARVVIDVRNRRLWPAP